MPKIYVTIVINVKKYGKEIWREWMAYMAIVSKYTYVMHCTKMRMEVLAYLQKEYEEYCVCILANLTYGTILF